MRGAGVPPRGDQSRRCRSCSGGLFLFCKTDTWSSRMLYHYSRAPSSWSPASALRLGPQLCLPSSIAATLPCATHSCTPQRCSSLHERDGNRVWQAARLVGHQAPHLRAREACPVSTGGGTRRVQLVREEGRDASS